jgi:peptidoglycan-associated lipoprotein
MNVNTRTIVGPMTLLLMLGAGCAKQPATAVGVSTPSPGPAVGTADPSTQVGVSPRSQAEAGSLRPDGDQTVRSLDRPRPQDFKLISDLPDIFFDYDRHEIRPDARRVLDANALWLRANGRAQVLIEGHCDERGTDAYNLALGQLRATAARNYLVGQGVAATRISVISYGEQRPECHERTEACRARNRRSHFKVSAN